MARVLIGPHSIAIAGGGAAVTAGGFIDYNDAGTAAAPVALAAGVWTDIPNDGLGAFSNSAYAPHGVASALTAGVDDFPFEPDDSRG